MRSLLIAAGIPEDQVGQLYLSDFGVAQLAVVGYAERLTVHDYDVDRIIDCCLTPGADLENLLRVSGLDQEMSHAQQLYSYVTARPAALRCVPRASLGACVHGLFRSFRPPAELMPELPMAASTTVSASAPADAPKPPLEPLAVTRSSTEPHLRSRRDSSPLDTIREQRRSGDDPLSGAHLVMRAARHRPLVCLQLAPPSCRRTEPLRVERGVERVAQGVGAQSLDERPDNLDGAVGARTECVLTDPVEPVERIPQRRPCRPDRGHVPQAVECIGAAQ